MAEIQVRGFKRKTIAKTIRAKIKSWVATIDDEAVKKAIQKDGIVTGGAIASMLLGKNPNDYDFYFRTKESAKLVAEYYLKAYMGKETAKISKIKVDETFDGKGIAIYIKSAGVLGEDTNTEAYGYFESLPHSEMVRYFESETEPKKEEKKYRPLMISSNAITLLNDIQIILRFCGDPAAIHEFYDFVHCTNYFTEEEGVILNPLALEAILTRELRYVGSKFPLCSMFRLKKFIMRGWTVSAGDMLKIGWDINDLDLSQPEVLREQLIGMDAAYFHQVLVMLKEKGFGTANFELDRTYLFECINRVFDQETDIPNHDD